MTSILRFSDAAMIGIHAMRLLAREKGRLIPAKDLGKAIGASLAHLAKVMQRLVRAGHVSSLKGPSGGFILAPGSEDLSFLAVIEAIDGTISGGFCPFAQAKCARKDCIFGPDIVEGAEAMVAALARRTISDSLAPIDARDRSTRGMAATR